MVPQAHSMATGDVNRDGRPDVVTEFAGLIELLNHGAGGLGAASVIESDDFLDGNVVIGDIDQDGAADLIATRVWDQGGDASGGVASYLGTAMRLGHGDGTFGAWQTVEMNYQRVALGDLDEDGHLDLIGSPYNSPLEVRFGAGDGSFGAPVPLVSDARLCGCFVLLAADVDGDSHLDLVVDGLTVLLGDGAGHVARILDRQPVAANTSDNISVSIGDLDGDGRLDLAVGLQYNRRVDTWRGNGDGTFTPLQELPLDPPGAYSANTINATGIADLDGDGRGELLVLEGQRNTLQILPTGPDGRVPDADTGPELVTQVFALPMADVDGDGDLDVVTVSASNAFQVRLNRGDGTFVTGALLADAGIADASPSIPLVGDLDGDGAADLILSESGVTSIYFGTPAGDFSRPPQKVDPSYGIPIALADVDVDGHLDLVSYGAYDQSTALFSYFVARGDGQGGFGPPIQVAAARPPNKHVLVADFNLDGRPDLAIAVAAPDTSLLLLSGAGGSLHAAPLPGLGEATLSGLVAGDFDHDGKPDLAATHYAYGTDSQALHVQTFPGKGNGTFGRPVDTMVPDLAANDTFLPTAVPADLDGDGIPDLVVVHFQRDAGGSFEVRVFRAVGDGSFAPWTTAIAGSDTPNEVSIGDLNGDGHPDLATAGYWTGELTVTGLCR
jgi:hypothetical protein